MIYYVIIDSYIVCRENKNMKNVRDYGASGDGIALDTEPIQKAIDSGGMVYIP